MMPSPLRVRFDSFRSFLEATRDRISEEGLFLPSTAPLPVGSRVAFEVGLGDDFPLLRGDGEVVRTVEEGSSGEDPPGMAVRFLSTDAATRELVAKLVALRRKQGVAAFELPPPDGGWPEEAEAVPAEARPSAPATDAGAPQKVEADTGDVLEVPDLSDELATPGAAGGTLASPIDDDLDALLADTEGSRDVADAVPSGGSAPPAGTESPAGSGSEAAAASEPDGSGAPAEPREQPAGEPAAPYYLARGRSQRRRSRAWLGWLAAAAIGAGLGALAYWQGDAVREAVEAWRTPTGSAAEEAPAEGPAVEGSAAGGPPAPGEADGEKARAVEGASDAPTREETPVELSEAPERAASRAAASAAPPEPAGEALPALTGITEITWEEVEGATVLTLTANGVFLPGSYDLERLNGGSPRVVIRIRGVRDSFTPRLPVGTAQLIRVRTGLHDRAGGSELHVVADLRGPEVRVLGSSAEGETLQVRFGAATGSP